MRNLLDFTEAGHLLERVCKCDGGLWPTIPDIVACQAAKDDEERRIWQLSDLLCTSIYWAVSVERAVIMQALT